MNNSAYDIVYPNPTPEGVTLEKNVPVTMRDGVTLALDIYKPAGDAVPRPVILAYSPFPKERFFESAKPAFYCARGYVCAQASERGIGVNQGRFSFHGEVAARDGYDIIEWLAAQSWCDGSVAMMGASGYGVMQWLTAPLNPPHLKALVVLATTDNYRGLCYPGGVLRKPFVLNLVAGFSQAAIWPGPVAGKELPVNVVAGILSHHEDGAFWWEHGGGWTRVGEIKAPILNIMNAPNRLHALYHLRSYADITSPKKLVITPWTSENYQPWLFETTAFNEYVLRWLDYWCKGADTGIMDEPEVAVYDNGTGAWRYESEYPLERTVWQPYYLHAAADGEDAAGGLDREAPGAGETPHAFRNISLNTALTASYGMAAPPPAERNHAVFLSEPLEDDVRVWGPVSCTVFASTTEEVTSDWSFFVKIGEMVPDGVPRNPVTGRPEVKPEATDAATPENVQVWSWGSLKTKFRLVDERLSRPGLPWHPYRDPEELRPNTVYEFAIELQPVFKTFKKGCRLWLKIACDDALFSTLDSASRYVETPLSLENDTVRIYHDAAHPSHLLLPVVPDAPEITPVPPPLRGAVPGAPRFTERHSE
jgi:predicted acyl esterase